MLSPDKSESVKVLIRCRPFNQQELVHRSIRCVEIHDKHRPGLVKLLSPIRYKRRISRLFRFDAIYDEYHRTEQIFMDFVQSLVCDVTLNGYSGTVFAYGQTGSGKSWTMTGCPCHSENGLISTAIEHVFDLVHHAEHSPQEWTVKCAYLEIYNEELHDLLKRRSSSSTQYRLELRENPRSAGVNIVNLTWQAVYSIDECLKLKRQGDLARTMGSTQMNRDSSRSHTMFSLAIEHRNAGESRFVRMGKLNFVDLAGSERQIKTGASGQQLLESAKINLSLSALNKVISSLVNTRVTHIPYRDSKLTRLLQDSIGGTTKTIMIACISPSEENYDETLCTLRYASRTKNIQNTPIVNESSPHALLRQYADEIKRLRAIIDASKVHLRSLSRHGLSNETDDQHSLKTVREHRSKVEPTTDNMNEHERKCQRTVSCQTMSDTMINSSFQSIQTMTLLYDDNCHVYRLFAWHICQIVSRQLTLFIQQINIDYGWMGTLTTTIMNDNVNQPLKWRNYLDNRQCELRLRMEENSTVTHFDIEKNSSSLILLSSTESVLCKNIPFIFEFDQHRLTLKDIDGRIYILVDIVFSSLANDSIEFLLVLFDRDDHCQLCHMLLNKNERINYDEQQYIEVRHCCCFDDEEHRERIKFVSCSHLFSFVNMSCEVENDETRKNLLSTQLHLIELDDKLVHWT